MNSPHNLLVRRMAPGEENAVAALIHRSTNAWYQAHGSSGPIFAGDPSECRVFPDTYEDLDPGCCVVACDGDVLVGSCFFHPRHPTHLSVGIVNTDPAWAGRGVAGQMLTVVLAEADRLRLPVRLVSSLGNLDSFSLYTRHGFVPVGPVFQDMVLPTLAPDGLPAATGPDDARVRPATTGDAPAIAAREHALVGLSRRGDWQYFLDPPWHVSVLVGDTGEIDGALGSVNYPACRMIGPGFAATEAQAAALLRAELIYRAGDNRSGGSPVFLVPVTASGLVAQCYGWGARTLELHIAQVRPVPGPVASAAAGGKAGTIVFPTFLPETG